MRRFCHPLCSVTKQNRSKSPRHKKVQDDKVLLSPNSRRPSDDLVAVLELADRQWESYQEALSLGRNWPHPFAWVSDSEGPLPKALRAKGYL